MKRVLVYRHAKTEKTRENTSDFVRELTEEGERQAKSIGRILSRQDLVPQLIVTSDAVRAVQTAELTREEGGFEVTIREREELYGADAGDYMSVLREQDDSYSTIMVVGHNPAVEDLLGAIVRKDITMKTGWVAVLDFDVSAWEELGEGAPGRVEKILHPEP
ncbi:MAG: SixA phosphatase family protein [Spirochaetaceae bacterium]